MSTRYEAHDDPWALLTQIESVALSDHDTPGAFAAQLADEQRWTMGQAIRVMAEYRRFLVLTQLGGRKVCPSQAVDEVWHLHLTQTRAYERLCSTVFGRFLHHEPSRGGATEDARHRDMYTRTLERYREVFGAAPPSDIWPDANVRFARPTPKAPTERTSLTLRLPLTPGRRALLLLTVSLTLGWWLGQGWSSVWATPQSVKPLMAGYAAVLLVVAVCVACWRHRQRVRDDLDPTAYALDPFEAAQMRGGIHCVVETALAEAVAAGRCRLEVLRDRLGRITGARLHHALASDGAGPSHLHPVVATGVAGEDGQLVLRSAVVARLVSTSAAIERRLEKAGLILSPAHGSAGRLLLSVVMAGLLTAAMWILIDSSVQQGPVALLVSLMTVNALLIAVVMMPRLSPEGLRAMYRFRQRHAAVLSGAASDRKTSAPDSGAGSATWVASAVALYGTQALVEDDRFLGINQALAFEPSIFGVHRGGSLGYAGGDAAPGGCGAADAGCGGGGCGGGGCGGG